MRSTAKLMLVFFSFLIGGVALAEQAITNVSYSAVTALDVGEPDKVISYGASELQRIEGWFPENTSSKGDVIFIHGGCWLGAYDIAHTRPVTEQLSNLGYRVWSIEYRRAGNPGGGWPNTYLDILKATEVLINQDLIDSQKTIITGHSAGGHLALLAGAEYPERFSAVVGLAAISDLKKYSEGENGCQRATTMFMGSAYADMPLAYDDANPVMKNLHQNTWLIFGDADQIVPTHHKNAVVENRQVLVSEAGHFDFVHPNSKAWQQVTALFEQL